MVNVHAIINHFSPKIESWTTARNLSSLTEEQASFTVHLSEFLADRSMFVADRSIGYWHDIGICLSVCSSICLHVMLCIVATRYIP